MPIFYWPFHQQLVTAEAVQSPPYHQAKEGESIRSFMNRFNVVTLEIQNLEQSTMMAIMMSGLLKNNLKKLLIKTYPQNFLDMLACAEKYVRMEEAFAEDTPAGSAAVRPNKERHPR